VNVETLLFTLHAKTMMKPSQVILVDVIIPVHNASSTLDTTVRSALQQRVPVHLLQKLEGYSLEITVCCYDDGSTDNSWSILQDLHKEFKPTSLEQSTLSSKLVIAQSEVGIGRGAGFARNRAVDLQTEDSPHHFLCLLDSDDTMHPHRIAEQTSCMLDLSPDERGHTLLGCQFDRDPPDSTWHYSNWANNMTDEQLRLERFREVTIVQPTWFLCRERFKALGGYVEAPAQGSSDEDLAIFFQSEKAQSNRLVHPKYDTLQTLRLAEDLRFFHDHLDRCGRVKLHRTPEALVTYKHTGSSQSFRTSRKLLLQLRVLALERNVLRPKCQRVGSGFIIWGAGRDGKDFFKALSDDLRSLVYCFVDVGEKKLESGSYVNRELFANVPIVHFSFMISDPTVRARIQSDWERGDDSDELQGRITKSKPLDASRMDGDACRAKRRREVSRAPLDRQNLDLIKLQTLPVIVCVAKNRTNGALERNIASTARTEGQSLWHFS
jgi:glycosyltransferase involved in cell wall biosynthesis